MSGARQRELISMTMKAWKCTSLSPIPSALVRSHVLVECLVLRHRMETDQSVCSIFQTLYDRNSSDKKSTRKFDLVCRNA